MKGIWQHLDLNQWDLNQWDLNQWDLNQWPPLRRAA